MLKIIGRVRNHGEKFLRSSQTSFREDILWPKICYELNNPAIIGNVTEFDIFQGLHLNIM